MRYLRSAWSVVLASSVMMAGPILAGSAPLDHTLQESAGQSSGLRAGGGIPSAVPGLPPGPLGPIEPSIAGNPDNAPVWQPPAEDPHAGGCCCPSCNGDGGFHVYQAVDTAPMYMPDHLDAAESSWLPSIEEDWIGQPLGATVFGGMFLGEELIRNQVELEPGLFTGVRFNRDYDARWAWETRVAFAQTRAVNLLGPENARDAYLGFVDSSLHYSRFYGKRWKSYLSLGAGMAYFDTEDHLARPLREFIPTLPFGAGIKYRLDDWMVLRFDVRDNFALGERERLANMHNLTVAGGFEWRFGGSSHTFYPWIDRSRM